MKRILLLALLWFGGVAHAQTPGENLRVYLITFGPGDAVWERFGHNALWVEDVTQNEGVAYNWGMFSFDQPGFVPRLMKGRMQYWMQGYPARWFIDQYVAMNRSVWVQELNLAPDQRLAMKEFVEWNAREENKYYRYDYFRDNCSTRIRDAIDRATRGTLQRTLIFEQTGSTYRSHTQALTYTDPLTYTGLMLAMGPAIDRPLNAWEEGFIPMQLYEWVKQVKVRAADGSEQPLVLAEQNVFTAKRDPVAERAPNLVPRFVIAGILIALLFFLLSRLALTHRPALLALAALVGLWSFGIGFFGTLIALLWACTDHVVTYGNENVLQANSLSLALAVLGPAALLGRAWALRWSVWVALFIAGCSVLGLVIQVLPQFDQANGEVIALMGPVHGVIAYILWQRWRTHHIGSV